jgi:SAM-dependent methyltransferase
MVYKNKRDWILKFIRGRKVLDLGCVGHSLGKMDSPYWLHGFIAQHAGSVLGVDILKRDVEILNQQGYRVLCADVLTMDLRETFEVIVAGDLIEHLSNPGGFLDQANRHLTSDGTLLITTPNPVTLMRFFQLLSRGRMDVNPEHTCWFTPQVLGELARRNGLRIAETAYVDDDIRYQNRYYPGRSFLAWPVLIANYPLCRIRPQLSETQCFALQKESV